ncbi:hypothetical protein C241_15958 [Bradyrhizobium lupini HPC(L)]|uniref:Transposase n=1 Tax=Bradyrhizobium lupini HPC(L) TaxID=1229491 RepID=A0ABP2RQP1_RHILU|nr:hypothetical protein C241_15958 [Bradyrhizobium lupini HPC(L)]
MFNLVRIPRQAKKPVFLFDQFERHAVFWASAVLQIRGIVKLFAAHAVKAFIGLSIEVATGRTRPPKSVYAGDMPRIARRAHKVVIRNVETLAQPFEAICIGAHKFGYRQA